MNAKLKTVLTGAAESATLGLLIGLGSVWTEPKDVVLTASGVAVALTTGVKFSLIYLLGYLRKNAGFSEK